MTNAARPSLDLLQECMKSTQTIRNVCILAHVDHGKTTIADSLLATNRLVSRRMAGLIRYLDDRIDEQERGITMKSSAVSLLNLIPHAGGHRPQLLNVIDTPGHIDFSSEVGAALRVSDGALIVVDLVEGTCVQTREAIKQAFVERCKMVLLLNKVDKLIVELHKDVNEIFLAITHAIEDCNAIIAELYQYEMNNNLGDEVDIENTGLLFSPDAGNVIFASAIDGWGFTTRKFAEMFEGAIKNTTVDELNRQLWNFDAFVDSKSEIKLGAIEKAKTNLFTQLVLKTIYYVYSTIVLQMQKDKIGLIAEKLKIGDITREMNHNDCKIQLRAVLQAWSPLADVILQQITAIIPPPNKIGIEKVKYLLDYNKFIENEVEKANCDQLVNVLNKCDSNSNATIAYVAKMFCVDKKNLSENKPKIFVPKPRDQITKKTEIEEVQVPAEKEVEEITESYKIIALARVLSGKLETGQEVEVLNGNSRTKIQIGSLYMLFGRELVLVDEISAGNICGIAGLDSAIIRTATLSNLANCVPFVEHPSPPAIVRNAIEPKNPKDLPILRRGLRTLMQSDSCVQVQLQETGEHVILTAGDVHLAKCLEDLTSIFAKIEINVSSPMVSLRETATNTKLENIVTCEIAQLKLEIVAVHLPDSLAKEVEKNWKILNTIEIHQQAVSGYELFRKRELKKQLNPAELKQFKTEAINQSVRNVQETLKSVLTEAETSNFAQIWSLGLTSDSINLLINATTNYKRHIFQTLDETDPKSCFDNFILNAFNSTCKSGPLCEEPLKNTAFIIKSFDIVDEAQNLDGSIQSGAAIESSLSSSFREAFFKQLPRLMEPMFTTTIQVNTNILGKVYGVVNKRHGKVLDAVGMDEAEKAFLVRAQIPVMESEGFANEVRKTTSGQAIPSLKFSHFEVIDGDPFYEPQEEDEEDETINIEAAVRATKLRIEIRKRKGLQVEEQVVVHAEKQRTLNKKK